ncbi:MAG: molybdenum cofactor guanylyltransferase [Rhizobiales bacterium]|nr:molybdenum cofactor guanylyltransferase [Hyphomicrobiales bacterium]
MTLLAAIIAGGAASRMGGREKLFLEVGGRSILDRILARLAPHADLVVINANGDAARFADLSLPVVPDRLDSRNTPLVGLHACLAWAKEQGLSDVVTVASDTPFLPGDLVMRLQQERQFRSAAIACSGGQGHYVTGLWRAELHHDLHSYLVELGERRAAGFAAHVRSVEVEWPVIPFDPFCNINTPADLAEAQRIAAEFNP